LEFGIWNSARLCPGSGRFSGRPPLIARSAKASAEQSLLNVEETNLRRHDFRVFVVAFVFFQSDAQVSIGVAGAA